MNGVHWQLAATLRVVSTNSLQPITLHCSLPAPTLFNTCSALHWKEKTGEICSSETYSAVFDSSAVCFLTAVLLLDPTRPDGFFSAGRLQTRQAAVQPPVLSCCRRYCSLTARLQLTPACAHKLCTVFRLQRLEMDRQCRF